MAWLFVQNRVIPNPIINHPSRSRVGIFNSMKEELPIISLKAANEQLFCPYCPTQKKAKDNKLNIFGLESPTESGEQIGQLYGIAGNQNLIRVAVARDPAQASPIYGTWTGFPGDSLGMTVAVNVISQEADGAAYPSDQNQPYLSSSAQRLLS